jgi:isoleucyl-tRNA synthetase
MDTSYIESVWWSLKRLHERGLLFEADKVTTYCPRCGTALSDAETAMGYTEVEDPSVFVLFRLVEAPDPSLVGAALLGWTTTPWTLISNTGVAVADEATYVEVAHEGERLILAASLRERVLPGSAEVRSMAGNELVGARYEPLYPNVEGAHRVVAAEFVSLEDGTGVVHMAPAFGPEDLEVGRREGWPTFKPVDGEGRFTDEAPPLVRGTFFKEADPLIVEELRARGLLLRAEKIVHMYPLCWRCSTPLLFYARTSWYVGTTQVRDRLLEVNDSVDWFPEHIKHGRYGDWLENNVDWALSRERYWGTPLPIWRCEREHATAVGSLAELSERAGRDVTGLDPHRPGIDEVTFACPECGAESRRVPEVIDTWYDSGAMPFAQWGYHPDLGRGLERFAERFPADFISEAIDQTRGWFYTLMAEGVLHFDSTTYRNVVCLGHIVDTDGRKMSKSLGNAIDPWDVLNRQGADALRWYLLTTGSPWASRRVGMEILDEVVRQFLLTLWNVYAFFVTYANASGFDPDEASAPAVGERSVLDRWVLSQLQTTAAEARVRLEAYDATGAGRRIEGFVDDLSNWYVRRSRRRFWNPGGEAAADASAAFHTLFECLVTVSTLLAPFTPFIADAIWRNLAAGRAGRPESVHLADYPEADVAAIDDALDAAMEAVRTIVGLGRTVRTETKTRVRQPLAEAVVHLPGGLEGLEPLLELVADELNVHRVVVAESAGSFGRWHAKPNFRALGPALGPRVKEVAVALAADDGSLAGELATGASVVVHTSGGDVTLGPGDVDLSQDVREGWGVASEGGVTLALDLHLTDDLRREGVARELIRAIQEARKAAGLEISDRIQLGVEAGPVVSDALTVHRDGVAGETLAVDVIHGEVEGPAVDTSIDGEPVRISVRRADYASPARA